MTDGRGNTRQATNGSQTVTASVAHDAWGYQLGSTFNTPGPIAPYQWNAASGYRADGDEASGFLALQKVGARYYDCEFGCFLTRDTDLSQRPYAYCDGDPVNNSDPSGHQASAFPTTAQTAAHNDILAGITDIQRGGDPGSGNIPVGNVGSYNAPTDTFSFTPVTYQGGSADLGISKLFSSPTLEGTGSLSIAGGSLNVQGSYPLNGSGGSFTGEYDHPISNGFGLGVTFGTRQGPGYILEYHYSK